jgi:uncharacterized protein (DUF488 family)
MPAGGNAPKRSGSRMARPFYTIGHGTRPIGEFIELLQGVQVDCVADVRTVPRSRTNPQYNRDTLPSALEQCEIGYEHLAALGGLRGRSPDVPQDVNAYWQNQSFHNYADYAMNADFRTGLKHLIELGRNRHCAIMCAETLWWRCHRRIIADYLLAAGETVLHIRAPRRVEPALLSDAARRSAGGILTYPVAA